MSKKTGLLLHTSCFLITVKTIITLQQTGLTSTLTVKSEPSSKVTLHCMIFAFFTPLKGDFDRRLLDDLWDS